MSSIFDLVKAVFTPDPPLPPSDDFAYTNIVTKGLQNVPKLPKEIHGYRADPKGRFGGTDGLETQPLKLDEYSTNDLYANTRAMRREKHLGIPQLSPQEIAAFVLKEGRGDMHVNDWDRNNPDLKELNSYLNTQYAHSVASYLTALKEKADVAKRKGITFAEAWNGTGTNVSGSSGKDYSKGYQAFLNAANHPKNANLLNYIKAAMKE